MMEVAGHPSSHALSPAFQAMIGACFSRSRRELPKAGNKSPGSSSSNPNAHIHKTKCNSIGLAPALRSGSAAAIRPPLFPTPTRPWPRMLFRKLGSRTPCDLHSDHWSWADYPEWLWKFKVFQMRFINLLTQHHTLQVRGQFSRRTAFKLSAMLLCLTFFAVEAQATSYPYRPKTGICGAAARGDLVAVIGFLDEDPSSIEERDRSGTPLYWATTSGEFRVVRELLARSAEVNASDSTGRTPLHAAASGRRLELVRILVANNADVHAKTKHGETPLLQACSYNLDVAAVNLLLENGAEPNVRARNGVTPLQAAAFRNIDAVKSLLEHGAEVNAPGFRNATALHWAVDGRQKAIVQLLLQHGADFKIKDEEGQTALHWAEERAAKAGLFRRRIFRDIAGMLGEAQRCFLPFPILEK
jgi:ankyrin repeat protein